MKRGDVVTVAVAGDYGKPRPAVVVQSNALPEGHESVVVCQMTSTIRDVLDFRVEIEPSDSNGLRMRSHVMADKPIAVRRERIGDVIGRLEPDELRRLNVALAWVMGLAD